MTRLQSLLARRWRWVMGVLIVALILYLIWRGYWAAWTGFGGYYDSDARWHPHKTLWDWMDLLFFPLAVAVGSGLVARYMEGREKREAEEREAQREFLREQERSRESLLQIYIDRISRLMENGLTESEPDDRKRSIARAHTWTVLLQLGGIRKRILLQFLYESQLIGQQPIVDLRGADLSGADLSEVGLHQANLSGASLSGADLSGAGLSNADLRRADLSNADLRRAGLGGAGLSEADLSRTFLYQADLSGADLSRAYLVGADLSGADLSGADLSGAFLYQADLSNADLSNANLSEAKVTDEQLAQAKSLEGATLPDGTKYASQAEPEPTPSETAPYDARDQTDQPGDLDAGDNDREGAD